MWVLLKSIQNSTTVYIYAVVKQTKTIKSKPNIFILKYHKLGSLMREKLAVVVSSFREIVPMVLCVIHLKGINFIQKFKVNKTSNYK